MVVYTVLTVIVSITRTADLTKFVDRGTNNWMLIFISAVVGLGVIIDGLHLFCDAFWKWLAFPSGFRADSLSFAAKLEAGFGPRTFQNWCQHLAQSCHAWW